MTLRDLTLRLRALLMPWRAERELDEELAFHIDREAQKLIEGGVAPAEARATALKKFGPVALAADECRDERGTAFVDNTIGDIQFALRTFRRSPLTSLTIVATVAVGLGVVAMVFTVLNILIFRIDTVPDINEMYAVERPQQAEDEASPFTRASFEALREETSVFSGAYAAVNELDLRVDGRIMAVNLVSGGFFHAVAVRPIIGRGLDLADDDRAGGNPVLVLSYPGWQRFFKGDPNVVGQTVLVSGAPFEIIGVMPEGFRGLQVSAPDFWAPLSRIVDFLPNVRGSEDKAGVQIVGRLKPGLSMESARAQLAAWDANQSASTGQRTMSIELVPQRGTVPQPLEAIALFAPLFFAFGLILLIGCANVANLLLARGVARQREIGIRLSVGASRSRIVRQLLTENVLLALAAAAGGYVVSRFALEGAVSWAMSTMPVDLGDVNLSVPAADWRVALFLVVASIAATAFFALIPALQATRIEPVRTLRGELVRDAKPGRARNALIGVQVFASALLLISSAIFLRSSLASSQFDPGIRTTDTVLIELNEPKRAPMLAAIVSDPTITAHAGVRPPLLAQVPRGFAVIGEKKTSLTYKHVSTSYFDVLGVPIVRGRGFTPAEVDGNPVAIVSESIARTLWPNGSGIGETFRLESDLTVYEGKALLTINPESGPGEPPLTPQTVTVIGVSRDVAGFRMTDVKEAGVFLPTTIEVPKTLVIARVQGNLDLARQALLERLTRIDPNMGMIITLRTVARLETFFLQIGFWVSLILGGLALLLTVSGLFSVLSYLVEQRTKEIGVRIALGASAQRVTHLMLAQTARPVVFGLLAGAGLAALLATLVLSNEWGALIATIVHVTDPVAYLGSVVVIVAACMAAAWIPASRAARVDPMKTLRQE
jgi:predicted permease